MVVWPQTKRKKILAGFKLGGGTLPAYYIINIVHVHLSGSIVILSLEVQKMYIYEQSHDFANLEEM